MLDRLLALETFGIKLGLENITLLCEALGHPERSFVSLHVAGTNGKGSVTAMTHAALAASEAQLSDDQIALFMALGGGWETDEGDRLASGGEEARRR